MILLNAIVDAFSMRRAVYCLLCLERKYLAAATMLLSAALVSFHWRVLRPQSGLIQSWSGLRYWSISSMRSLISCSDGTRGLWMS